MYTVIIFPFPYMNSRFIQNIKKKKQIIYNHNIPFRTYTSHQSTALHTQAHSGKHTHIHSRRKWKILHKLQRELHAIYHDILISFIKSTSRILKSPPPASFPRILYINIYANKNIHSSIKKKTHTHPCHKIIHINNK